MKRLVLVLLLMAASVAAQPGNTRRATNVEALLQYPAYFHLRPLVVVGDLKLLDSGESRLATEGGSIRVVFEGPPPEGIVEVRGEFWDIGRFNADDPRLARYDLRRTFGMEPESAWPRSGQVTALIATAIVPTTPPQAPTIRNLVLFPSRFVEQKVTLTGQFSGRNLLGDLPDAPGVSRYDFVVRSADAAVWVTNLRPRGRDFELALDTRIDTGRWVEVSGTARQGRGLLWLDAEPNSLKLTQAPKDTPELAVIRVPAAPPPEVIFSAPTADETDVPAATTVRIQFSRDMDPTTLRGRVRVRYADEAAQPASRIEFSTQYMPGNRVLELKFVNPLEPLRTVVVDFAEGVLGTDKQPLQPWTLRFQTASQ
jgi:hypothetical protein